MPGDYAYDATSLIFNLVRSVFVVLKDMQAHMIPRKVDSIMHLPMLIGDIKVN